MTKRSRTDRRTLRAELVRSLNRAIALRSAIEASVRTEFEGDRLPAWDQIPVWVEANRAVERGHKAIAQHCEACQGRPKSVGSFPNEYGVVEGRLVFTKEIKAQIRDAFERAVRELNTQTEEERNAETNAVR